MQQQQIQIDGWHQPITISGDAAILQRHKTAFFCSRQYPAKAVLPALNWAEQARDSGLCVISGFHSLLEENARDILLAGQQPLIWAIARNMYDHPPQWAKDNVDNGKLLILSPVDTPRPSGKTADIRNRLIASIADNIVVAHATPNGKAAQALKTTPKPITHLVT